MGEPPSLTWASRQPVLYEDVPSSAHGQPPASPVSSVNIREALQEPCLPTDCPRRSHVEGVSLGAAG